MLLVPRTFADLAAAVIARVDGHSWYSLTQETVTPAPLPELNCLTDLDLDFRCLVPYCATFIIHCSLKDFSPDVRAYCSPFQSHVAAQNFS